MINIKKIIIIICCLVLHHRIAERHFITGALHHRIAGGNLFMGALPFAAPPHRRGGTSVWKRCPPLHHWGEPLYGSAAPRCTIASPGGTSLWCLHNSDGPKPSLLSVSSRHHPIAGPPLHESAAPATPLGHTISWAPVQFSHTLCRSVSIPYFSLYWPHRHSIFYFCYIIYSRGMLPTIELYSLYLTLCVRMPKKLSQLTIGPTCFGVKYFLEIDLCMHSVNKFDWKTVAIHAFQHYESPLRFF